MTPGAVQYLRALVHIGGIEPAARILQSTPERVAVLLASLDSASPPPAVAPAPCGPSPAGIRLARRTLLDLRESYEPPDERVLEQEALDHVMDAWDEYEYAAGTHEGGARQVIS